MLSKNENVLLSSYSRRYSKLAAATCQALWVSGRSFWRTFWQQKFRDFERAAAVGEQLDAAGDAQDDELFSQLIDEETNSNLIIFIQVTVRVGGGRRTDGRLDR